MREKQKTLDSIAKYFAIEKAQGGGADKKAGAGLKGTGSGTFVPSPGPSRQKSVRNGIHRYWQGPKQK